MTLQSSLPLMENQFDKSQPKQPLPTLPKTKAESLSGVKIITSPSYFEDRIFMQWMTGTMSDPADFVAFIEVKGAKVKQLYRTFDGRWYATLEDRT